MATADLTQAVADLQAEVAEIGTEMDALFKALQDAQTSGDQVAIDKATADIRAQIDALKAVAARDMPPAPPPTP